MVRVAGWLCNYSLINSSRLSNVSQWWGAWACMCVCVCVCVLVYSRDHYLKMSSSHSDMRPESDECMCAELVKAHTHTHTHTHLSWPLTCLHISKQYYTLLQSLWTWPVPVEEGGGAVTTYKPGHVCPLDRLCVFRHSAAMQSSARGNQLQSVTLSCCAGEESLHLSVLMNKDSDVWFWNKEPSFRALDCAQLSPFHQRWRCTHTRELLIASPEERQQIGFSILP